MAYALEDLKDMMDEAAFKEERRIKHEAIYISRRVTNSYKVIPLVNGLTETTTKAIYRMNSLGSLFYFSTVVLGKNKLQRNPDIARNLHWQMCLAVEKDGIQDVIEIPRDHFKSTLYSEAFTMWRALPFTLEDEILFRRVGYDDNFIAWMRRAHRQNYRWLIISEVIKNAVKLGVKISSHYENNQIFRWVYSDIIPDSSCTWTADSLHHRRTKDASGHGEGTYDFLGVGAALQSRHYDGTVQDDLIGKEALKSPTVMEDTIDYHKLLVGAFDADVENSQRDNEELIVGNRWAWNDLNSHIRANEPYFNFTTHSALGGCCKLHPYGTPIFPEAFSLEKLERWKRRLGSYLFSCQFLNVPINPAEVKFRKADLRYFHFEQEANSDTIITGTDSEGIRTKKRAVIKHHVHEGDVIADVLPRTLRRFMIVDPNHAEQQGRCRHAITVTGVLEESAERRVYLLDVWAEASSIQKLIKTMFHLAVDVWKLDEIWLETIAAQRYLKYHLDYEIALSDNPKVKRLRIKELKTPRTANAKQMRIDGLGPIIERHELWVNTHGQTEFMEEFEQYPNGKLRDVLDTLGYGPQVWGFEADSEEIEDSILERKAKWERETRLN